MNDRELLELAAKAAGITGLRQCGPDNAPYLAEFYDDHDEYFRPLTDDGDALRLAVKLKIHVNWAFTGYGKPEEVQASHKGKGHLAEYQELGKDEFASTRRAIVRAAAEIGKSMQ